MYYRPSFLKKGDKIVILSTAKRISTQEINFAVQWLTKIGLEPIIGQTIDTISNQFAGEDSFRAEDFQQALNNPDIKAILFARGGYGTNRVLDKIDWTRFIDNPKWLIGFSDLTLIHNRVNQFYGIETIHGPMPITFEKISEKTLHHIESYFFGNLLPIKFQKHPLNKEGNIKGQIFGGNLSILYSLLGTNNGFNLNDKILFFEDLDEYMYHFDRMIIAMKNAGKFEGLKAILVGGITNMKDNEIPFGKSIEEIILEHTAQYDFPIYFGAPFGHFDDNYPLILGANIAIDCHEQEIELRYI
jgi:muramoyltetrapeptide carboxypeptidase